jgi:hypothetical protein
LDDSNRAILNELLMNARDLGPDVHFLDRKTGEEWIPSSE